MAVTKTHPIKSTLKAVSYTHLDVYKRQVRVWDIAVWIFPVDALAFLRLCLFNCADFLACVAGVKPVSYTHLDVYKRQSLGCDGVGNDSAAECGQHLIDDITDGQRLRIAVAHLPQQ